MEGRLMCQKSSRLWSIAPRSLFCLLVAVVALSACQAPPRGHSGTSPRKKKTSNGVTGKKKAPSLTGEKLKQEMLELAGKAKIFSDTVRGSDGRLTLYYRMKHRTVDNTLLSLLKGKLGANPPGTIIPYSPLNMIIITDKDQNVDEVKKLLDRLDHPPNQVLIRAVVVEITSSSRMEMGFNLINDLSFASRALLRGFESVAQADASVDYTVAPSRTYPGTRFSFAVLGKDTEKWGNLSLIIRALEESGNAEILSRPEILVTQAHQATITTGDEIPIQSGNLVNNVLSLTTTFKQTGVTLKVKPLFIGEDSVTIEVNPDVSAVTGYTEQVVTAGVTLSIPRIATRKASTKITLNNGEVLTIGGLYQRSDRVTETRVPLLGDIPFLGVLFRSKKKEQVYTELIFNIQAIVIKGEETTPLRVITGEAVEARLKEEADEAEEAEKEKAGEGEKKEPPKETPKETPKPAPSKKAPAESK